MTIKQKIAIKRAIARWNDLPAVQEITAGLSPEKRRERLVGVLKRSDFRKRPDFLEYAISLIV